MTQSMEQGTYYYIHGWGAGINRKIEFLRENPQHPKSIYAQVSRLHQRSWEPIYRLSGKDINVEQMSPSEKVEALRERELGHPIPLKRPDKPLEEFSITEQDEILKNFEPYGPWSLEITSEPDPRTRIEKITYISIYNPR